MARHETFTAIINAVIGWAAFAGVLAFIVPDGFKITIDAVFSLIFWLIVGAYFYLDYHATHKKHKPKIIPPPSTLKRSDTDKRLQSKTHFWFTIFMLSFQTATAFLINIAFWGDVTIVNGVGVVSYENLASILFSGIGIIMIIFIAYRIKNRYKYIRKTGSGAF